MRSVVDREPNRALIGEPGSRHRLQTPALVLDRPALERNIAAMAAFAAARSLDLRPHAKTHKSARIAGLQMAAGAVGQCVVTVGEAEALAAGGIGRILITSPVVGAAKIDRLMALNAEIEELIVVVDQPDQAALLARAAGAAGRPLKVLVDLDMGTHRTGAADPAAALVLGHQIAAANSLDLVGLQAYAGHLQHVADFAERRHDLAAPAAAAAGLRDSLAAAGLAPQIVTGGGTGTHRIDAAQGTFTELQAGSYIFLDVQYDAVALDEAEPRPFEPALFVATSVVSANWPGLATTDGGLKRFATDGPAPRIVRGAPPGATYRFSGDEHGEIAYAPDRGRLRVGDVVECLTPHCDPTVNLYDHYHVVEGDRLVDIWPVDGRGAV